MLAINAAFWGVAAGMHTDSTICYLYAVLVIGDLVAIAIKEIDG